MIWESPEQFQKAVAAVVRMGGQVHYCQLCGKLTGATYGGARWQRRYCSRACRQKAYRLRQGQRYDRPGRPSKTYQNQPKSASEKGKKRV